VDVRALGHCRGPEAGDISKDSEFLHIVENASALSLQNQDFLKIMSRAPAVRRSCTLFAETLCRSRRRAGHGGGHGASGGPVPNVRA
jgi:hypothetical protein